jgi:hypothetical protein
MDERKAKLRGCSASANEGDPVVLEECLDIVIDALTESGLDDNS